MRSNRAFDRIDKVNSLIQHEIDKLLQRDKMEHKGFSEDLILSITKVSTNRDLKNANVHFSVMPLKFRGDAKKFLDRKAGEWQRSLGKKITLKYIPKLRFFYDEGQENALTVEKILSEIKQKEDNA